MKILKRVKQIIDANINHLLEKAEDPEKLIKQLVREMDENIVRVRLEVAKAIAAEKRLERRRAESEKAVQRWTEAAGKAVAGGDDGRAREALGKKLDAERDGAELEEQHAKAAAVSRSMKEALHQLEDKVQEARRRKEILIARKYRAEAQKRVLEASDELGRLSTRAGSLLDSGAVDASARFQSLEDKVVDLEVEAEARQEVVEAARDVEGDLQAADRQEHIEQALEEMKQSRKGAGGGEGRR